VTDQEILDMTVVGNILAMAAENPSANLYRRLLTLYRDEGEKTLSSLLAMVAEENLLKTAELAHSLKSSSANLGAMKLADKCQHLEMLAKQGEGSFRVLTDEITKDFQVVIETLESLETAQ
jgi:HPt (histidine-containing phosphotransfer) domain-containing protein